MFQDLALLLIIGFILEALCTNMSGFVLDAIPTTTFSLLIVFIAVVRWNLWGLLTIPIMAAATVLGGHFHIVKGLAAVYDWKCYLSASIGLLIIGLDVIVFKKRGTKKTIQSTVWMISILIINYILYNFVQLFFFRLFSNGNPFIIGESLYKVIIENEDGTLNISNYYMDYGVIYNLFGLAISVIGTIILRSQGVVNNVVDNLIEDKKNAEMLKKDAEEFKVDSSEAVEAEEESKPAVDSEKNS